MSAYPLGKFGIVIGDGVGGLVGAQVLADHFEDVIVIEREHLPIVKGSATGVTDDCRAAAWIRSSFSSLRELFPGFLNVLWEEKARTFPDSSAERESPRLHEFSECILATMPVISEKRSLLETVIRRRLQERKNVRFLRGCRSVNIIAEPDGMSVVSVSYLTREGVLKTLPADLVVDSVVGGIPTLTLLKAIGLPTPEESVVGVTADIAATVYAIPEKAASTATDLATLVAGAREHYSIVAVLRLNDCRYVIVSEPGIGPSLLGGEQFRAFLRSLEAPIVRDAVSDAYGQGNIVQFSFPACRRRHLGRNGNFPRGLIPMGDAVCHYDSACELDVRIAATEAVTLRSLLSRQTDEPNPLATLEKDYLSRIESLVKNPWVLASLIRAPYSRPLSECQTDQRSLLEYQVALRPLAADDLTSMALDTTVESDNSPTATHAEHSAKSTSGPRGPIVARWSVTSGSGLRCSWHRVRDET
jgi:hypothetical protein